jgi:hypothetical protein|tara:strand:- start:280 stop:474 length:195 start_codon:yes stop_codon:yes gene_type:complete
MLKDKKNIIIIISIIFGLYIILDFRDHNFKKAVDACIVGSKKLEQPMSTKEAKKFCEDKIREKK